MGILISRRLRHRHQSDLEIKNSIIENITIEISLRNNKSVLGTSLYRPRIPMHLNLLRNLVIWYANLRAKGNKSWLLVSTITLTFSRMKFTINKDIH